MKSSQVSLRIEILKFERDNQSHLELIQSCLEIKYKSRKEITREKLLEAQTKILLANIKSKCKAHQGMIGMRHRI